MTVARLEEDHFLKRGIERTLQVCVEAVIDVAKRILSRQDLPPVTSGAESLEALQRLGIIRDAGDYARMVQIRNFVVHRYESVDNEVLVDICNRRLSDFEAFIREIEQYGQTDEN